MPEHKPTPINEKINQLPQPLQNPSQPKEPGQFQDMVYQENRAQFDPEALRAHRGHWVAFSRDGKSILGSFEGLSELCAHLATVDKDPQDYVLEHLHDLDTLLGGAELP